MAMMFQLVIFHC